MDKIKRDFVWLKEDIAELGNKIPKKVSDIAAYATVFMAYICIFRGGLEHPWLAAIAAIGGSWVGVEVANLIAKAIGKNPKK